jgi:hypothetical protein
LFQRSILERRLAIYLKLEERVKRYGFVRSRVM